MRSMKNRRTAATSGTTGTQRLYDAGMAGIGNVSVVAMQQNTRSVRSATGKECCVQWRRYTTGCRWQRAGRMTRGTYVLYAVVAMRGFMRSAVTGGISVRLLCAGFLQ